ncbi:MAG: site-specific integrase [Deltaproteobacteria bacterium]|nr:site-specific integrase [Deltaproteobacteria bacterium]
MKEVAQNKNEQLVSFGDSYRNSKNLKEDAIWSQLKNISVSEALRFWYMTLKHSTRINYECAFKGLKAANLVDLEMDLRTFSLSNHESLVDDVKLISHWSEASRQARAAAYISFTGFLQRRTQGLVRKAMPSKEGLNKTFYKVREKVKTSALTQVETKLFLKELEAINQRDALIAKLILQGGKRKSEVLELEVKAIDFSTQKITYKQSKTRGTEKKTIIHYPIHIMNELKLYCENRDGLVFVTRNGKKVHPAQIDRNYLLAGKRSGISFRVTPHVLRVTLVTRLKELEVQDSDIMKITGHASPAQLSQYDKSDPSINATMRFNFV